MSISKNLRNYCARENNNKQVKDFTRAEFLLRHPEVQSTDMYLKNIHNSYSLSELFMLI